MHLRLWIKKEGLTLEAFGQRIERTKAAVGRYCNGKRLPEREVMPLIVRETRGEVLPNDFYPDAMALVANDAHAGAD